MLAQLKRIKEMDLTGQEVSILHVLAHGMQPEAGDYLWRLWVIIVRITQSSDAGNLVQECFVWILVSSVLRGELDTCLSH